jgi:hypothetical protein
MRVSRFVWLLVVTPVYSASMTRKKRARLSASARFGLSAIRPATMRKRVVGESAWRAGSRKRPEERAGSR